MQKTVLSVSQLNRYVKSLLEGDIHLSHIYLKGEISNFKNHYQSGHLYFSIKDGDAAVRCVMFRFDASRLKFRPEDGMSVICGGRVSLYERDGTYQFYADEMIPDGAGELSLAFEQIKQRLSEKGYFSSEHKKSIARFPRKIAVITSDTGAAVQDIINVSGRRYPLCELVLCPVRVQGDGAVGDLITALRRVQNFNDIDTVIIGRGGGSIEDLWAFNSELLAEEIYNCKIPVISAVGHETDFTICDFVADLRAPTPSAAAELAVPDINELRLSLDSLNVRLLRSEQTVLENAEMSLKRLEKAYILSNPKALFDKTENRFVTLRDRLINSMQRTAERGSADFVRLAAKLDSLSPLAVLSRGYSIAKKEGNILKSAEELSVGDALNIRFGKGNAECSVTAVSKE